METVITTLIALWVVAFIFFLYLLYQMLRLKASYNIIKKWIGTNQWDRLKRWDYDEISEPNLKNWYGLKYPKEEDYK